MPIREFLDGFPDTGEPLGGERDQHQVGLASADRRRHLLGDDEVDHHADQQRNRTLDGSLVRPPTWCFSWSKQGPIRASKNFREKR